MELETYVIKEMARQEKSPESGVDDVFELQDEQKMPVTGVVHNFIGWAAFQILVLGSVLVVRIFYST